MKKFIFASLALFPAVASAAVSYSNGFEGLIGPEWSTTTTLSLNIDAAYGGGTRTALGDFDNQTVTLTLGGFTPGASATLAFDFDVLDSWDGDTTGVGPDFFTVKAGSTTLLNATFANVSGYNQSYSVGNPLGGTSTSFPRYTSADESDVFTNHNYFGSSAYKFGGAINPLFTFVPTTSTVVFSFTGSGLQGRGDESWAIDNVRVVQQAVPEPASIAAVGLGGIAFLRRRRRA